MNLDWRPENLTLPSGVRCADSYIAQAHGIFITVVRQPSSAEETYSNQTAGIRCKNMPGRWAVCISITHPIWWAIVDSLAEALELAQNKIEEFVTL